jgi:hypothetical protein
MDSGFGRIELHLDHRLWILLPVLDYHRLTLGSDIGFLPLQKSLSLPGLVRLLFQKWTPTKTIWSRRCEYDTLITNRNPIRDDCLLRSTLLHHSSPHSKNFWRGFSVNSIRWKSGDIVWRQLIGFKENIFHTHVQGVASDSNVFRPSHIRTAPRSKGWYDIILILTGRGERASNIQVVSNIRSLLSAFKRYVWLSHCSQKAVRRVLVFFEQQCIEL